MKDTLKPGEDYPRAIRKLACKYSARLHRLLRNPGGGDPLKSVHQARREIKKLRFLLRLVRPKLKRPRYRQLKQLLRSTARTLAPFREAEVRRALLADFQRRNLVKIPAGTSRRARTVLTRKLKHSLDKLARSGELHKSRLRAGIQAWKLDGLDKKDLRGSVNQSRSRFVAAYDAALREPSPETLHDWRKRSKQLSYQLGVIRNLIPRSTTALRNNLKMLEKFLGLDHDLVVLLDGINRLPVETREKIRRIAGTRRARLQKSAFTTGRKIRRLMSRR